MIEPILRRFVEYEKRKQAVIIVTILTTLVVVWPAADDYFAAQVRNGEAEAQLGETQQQIAKLPLHQGLYAKKQQELETLERRTVSEKAAQNLQTELTELGRTTGCTVRRARLGAVTRRDWKDDDHPLTGPRTNKTGGQTPFRLESRQLSLSVTGSMAGLYKFLEGLHRIDKTIHSKAVSIKRTSEGVVSLDIELQLFDLSRKVIES